MGTPPRPRRNHRHSGVAPWHGALSERHPLDRRRRLGRCDGARAVDHGVLRVAVEDRGPGSRYRSPAARRGRGLLPRDIPERHAARRDRRRRPPRRQPRSRRARYRSRAARRRMGARGRAGRAGRPHRCRSRRAALASAGVHAARGTRGRRGVVRCGARGQGATQRAVRRGRGSGAPRPETSETGCSPAGRGSASRSRRR